MNPEETQDPNAQMTEAVGQVIGEILVIVGQVVSALRQQPGFDNAAFDEALRGIKSRPETSMLQQHALQMLLDRQSQ
ncbi:hypothetical protein ACXR0O_07630 [Verrucomicrobiota bacterium sgz303538]